MIDNTFTLISRIDGEIRRFITEELAKEGITDIVPSHGAIIIELMKHGQLPMNELARHIDRTPQTVTSLVKKLVKSGYVENRYDAVIMDPPSYGRGPSGEIWKLEEKVHSLVELCTGVLSEQPLFFALNSYTTGLSPSVMEYLLGITVARKFGGRVSADEIGLPVTQSGYVLPCGSTALWSNTL